jgi:hypothetical protein
MPRPCFCRCLDIASYIWDDRAPGGEKRSRGGGEPSAILIAEPEQSCVAVVEGMTTLLPADTITPL